jgi:hypothetical protein
MGDKASALAQYRLARATDTSNETDSGLLDLKIADLAADLATPTQQSAAASGQNPGKP